MSMRKTVLPAGTWRIVGGLIVLIVLVAVGNLLFLRTAQAQTPQPAPINFSHKVMISAGVDCLFCHPGADKSPVAGLPSVQKCMGCHSIIATNRPEILKLADYWKRQAPIPWPRINQLPRFVEFSMQAHVQAGINCETCHGNVSQMDLAQPIKGLNMGWCLDCHSRQPNAPQLRDCFICHK